MKFFFSIFLLLFSVLGILSAVLFSALNEPRLVKDKAGDISIPAVYCIAADEAIVNRLKLSEGSSECSESRRIHRDDKSVWVKEFKELGHLKKGRHKMENLEEDIQYYYVIHLYRDMEPYVMLSFIFGILLFRFSLNKLAEAYWERKERRIK